MSRSNSIKSNLANEGMGSLREEASRKIPRAGEDEDGADAILVFERGVAAMGPQKVVALELGMSESHLADHLRGDRTVAFHRIVRMCRKNPDAALVMLSELSRLAGLAPPTRPRKVDKREVQAATTRKVRNIIQLWQMVRADVAAELGTTTDDAEAALDEITDIRTFAK